MEKSNLDGNLEDNEDNVELTKEYYIKKYNIDDEWFIDNMTLSDDKKSFGILTDEVFYWNPYVFETISKSDYKTRQKKGDNPNNREDIKPILSKEQQKKIKEAEKKYGWKTVKRKPTWKEISAKVWEKEWKAEQVKKEKEKVERQLKTEKIRAQRAKRKAEKNKKNKNKNENKVVEEKKVED